MKFTLDTTEKTITIEGNFTKVEMTQLFDILDIENIEEYAIQTKTPNFWEKNGREKQGQTWLPHLKIIGKF